MSVGLLTIVLLTVLVVLLGFGVRIAFCLGFIAVTGILIFLEPAVLYQIAEVAADTGTNIFLITLPLFILMAEVVSFSGVGDDMYTAAQDWLSWLPGGLAISSIATKGNAEGAKQTLATPYFLATSQPFLISSTVSSGFKSE